MKIFNKLENNNNCNFDANGEKVFIDNLIHLFKNRGEVVVFDIGANIGEYSKMIETKSLELNIEEQHINFIQFEYGGANLDSHNSLMEIYEFLTDRGFKIAKIVPTGLAMREYKPFMENFQYSNYVAISKRVLEIL